jgi:hypothetical protein
MAIGHLKELSQFMDKPSDHDDLAEIKEILHRLQTLDVAAIESVREATEKKTGKKQASKKARWIGLVFFSIVLVAAMYLGFENRLLPRGDPISGIGGPSPQVLRDKERSLVARARALLISGDARGARKMLSDALASDKSEVAFAIAQSYDPNYLKDIPNVNAEPDRVRARYWYRHWYQLAVKSGLNMKKNRLDRVINAMWYHSRVF